MKPLWEQYLFNLFLSTIKPPPIEKYSFSQSSSSPLNNEKRMPLACSGKTHYNEILNPYHNQNQFQTLDLN